MMRQRFYRRAGFRQAVHLSRMTGCVSCETGYKIQRLHKDGRNMDLPSFLKKVIDK